ncbi:MAG: tetratricopeptide repeat protein [Actinomycetota bacterium]|nr:tetratricopeptide repeat protein [Actinomycetota bacterium]
MADSEQDVLVERLGRYPADRYPVQHATTQFHLGSLRLHAGQTGPALLALAAALDGFERAGLRLERAKAQVMLGAAFRTAGRQDDALDAFTSAAAAFEALGQPAEQAAACYNLGLVLGDGGRPEAAGAAWSQACTLFFAAGYPGQASAAARDHGALLLATGSWAEALPLLDRALGLAETARSEPAVGAAANGLGLAHLAAGDVAAALAVLGRALAAYPRSVLPAEHAMVKANLALAYEHQGNPARARLAARQALGVASVGLSVREQAAALLARLPGGADADLLSVLDAETQENWPALLREEIVRIAELPSGQPSDELRPILSGLLTRPGAAYDLAEALLQVVIEMAPPSYQRLVAAIVDACSGRPVEDTDRLRAVLGSAMARFAIPQWQRLAAALNAAAESAGQSAGWQ